MRLDIAPNVDDLEALKKIYDKVHSKVHLPLAELVQAEVLLTLSLRSGEFFRPQKRDQRGVSSSVVFGTTQRQ